MAPIPSVTDLGPTRRIKDLVSTKFTVPLDLLHQPAEGYVSSGASAIANFGDEYSTAVTQMTSP